MPQNKPVLHLVCNAHLDPVWQWDWQEGCLEAISTFRHAVEFLEIYPDLIFNHNEALLYEWVEQYAPPLFDRIRECVQRGRWHISGGWFLQPDCNMPEGESFVRLALYGRRYFAEKFGVEPQVAYNFDAFGHNGSLPQILSKLGFEMYIHTRPSQSDLDLPASFYRWQGVDGSKIYVYRSPTGSYCNEEGQVGRTVERMIQECGDQPYDQLLLWGVCDHGGGATHADMHVLQEWMGREDLPFVLRHSTPAAFLAARRAQDPEPPIHSGDLQKCFTGCYTSEAATKRAHRKLDALVHKAERYAAAAAIQAGAKVPGCKLDKAWRGHLFNTFHDILPGSSAEPGIASARAIFGHAEFEASEAILASQLALTQGEPLGAGIPLFVFNPHPHPVSAPVVTDFMTGWRPVSLDPSRPFCGLHLETAEGEVVPAQSEKSHSNIGLDWRRRLAFVAEVPAAGIRRYRILLDADESVENEIVDSFCQRDGAFVLENPFFRLELAAGLVRRLFDKRAGVEIVRGPAFVPLVMHDPGDAWGHRVDAYRDVAGTFSFVDDEDTGYLMNGLRGRRPEIQLVERGPVRTVAETLLRWGRSTIRMRYVLWHRLPYLDIDMRINWEERRKMLKLSLPSPSSFARAQAAIPFGAIDRPLDGGEHTGNRWVMLTREDGHALAVLNSAQHGFDVTAAEFRQTLLRSPVVNHMSFWDPLPEDRAFEFLDLGQHDVLLRLLSGPAAEIGRQVGLESDLLHMPLDPIVEMGLPKPGQGHPKEARGALPGVLALSDRRISLSALKRAEDGTTWAVRCANTTGEAVRCQVQFAGCAPVDALFEPFEAKTWRVEDAQLRTCDFQER